MNDHLEILPCCVVERERTRRERGEKEEEGTDGRTERESQRDLREMCNLGGQ
jgi:hypothetical protein